VPLGPGQSLGHYRLAEKLGEGGMGVVWKAVDTRLDREIAIKVLQEPFATDPDRLSRLEREARAVAALNHPNIVTLYSVEQADGIRFITMELVEGESLGELIPEHGLTVDRFFEIAAPLAEALAAAHARGVIHRDLKPGNIMVNSEGRPKILDFGLARLWRVPIEDGSALRTETLTQAGVVVGTVAYMAPEQAQGGAVDARSDIFSLGIVLYQMITGRHPFASATPYETVSAILNDQPISVTELKHSLPRQLGRIIAHCLEKQPHRRFQTALDLHNELAALRDELKSEPRAAAAAGAPKSVWTRWVLPTAVAASLLLVSILVVQWLRGNVPRSTAATPGIGSSGRPAIAVLHFQSHGATDEIRWLSSGLPSMLLTGLAQTPGLDVISSQRIEEVLRKIGRSDLEALDRGIAAEVARRSGAGAVVVGSIFQVGDEIRIDVQVEDVGSGRVLAAQSVRGSDVFPLVDELTERIRDSLRLDGSPALPGIAAVTTSSLEAWRHYHEGLVAVRNVRAADARDAFETALRIDPGFAMAAFELWQFYRNRDAVRSRDYLDQALAHLERLPEREKLQVQAIYQWREVGDLAAAASLLEQLLARYPDAEDAYSDLADIYTARGQSESALEVLEGGIEALPASGYLHNQYGYRLLSVSRWDQALAAFEAYQRLAPDEPNPYDSQAEAYLILGQPERAIELASRALEIDPQFGAALGARAWGLAMLGRYDEVLAEVQELFTVVERQGFENAMGHFMRAFVLSRIGRYREAREDLESCLAIADRTQVRSMTIACHGLEGWLAVERQDSQRAVQAAERELAATETISDPSIRAGARVMGLMVAGTAAARAGNLDAARLRLKEQVPLVDAAAEQFLTPNYVWWHQVLAGEIALVAGDLDTADAAFAAGEPPVKMPFTRAYRPPTVFANCLPHRDGRARVAAARGHLDVAIELYGALNTPDRTNKWTAMFEPRFVLASARLLDRKGDTAGAREQYARFAELWRDADPGLPELEEAQAWLARHPAP